MSSNMYAQQKKCKFFFSLRSSIKNINNRKNQYIFLKCLDKQSGQNREIQSDDNEIQVCVNKMCPLEFSRINETG